MGDLKGVLARQRAHQGAAVHIEKRHHHFQGALDFAVELLGGQVDEAGGQVRQQAFKAQPLGEGLLGLPALRDLQFQAPVGFGQPRV